MRRLKVAMKRLFAALVLAAAVAPASAAVDVSVDTIVRPHSREIPYWWFSPAAGVRCRGTDSAALSAWFVMADKNDSIRYRDSVGPLTLAPGEDTTLVFAPFLMTADTGIWTARCSVAAPGDTCPANDTAIKPFLLDICI
jgi:hypothetical protein